MLTAKPRLGSKGTETLQSLVGNLTLLYIKSKNYHWNVSGLGFHGLHETFDGLQEVALEWADIIAERMRACELPVCACAEAYLSDSWFKEGDFKLQRDEMVEDMVRTLEIISGHVLVMIQSEQNPVTQNILQDLAASIDKQAYFLRSSL